jgi:Trk K+ transport system NAD-binding subunit
MNAVVAGPDPESLGRELEDRGVEVEHVQGLATGETLEAAGIATADLLVLTEMSDASAIPVAKDLNPDVRVVTYSRDSLPEFARGQADLAVDPSLLSADVVADELV